MEAESSFNAHLSFTRVNQTRSANFITRIEDKAAGWLEELLQITQLAIHFYSALFSTTKGVLRIQSCLSDLSQVML